MKSEEIEYELSVKEVYLTVIQLCKDNLKVIYGLSLLMFLLNIINLLLSTFRDKIENIPLQLLLGVFVLVFMIFSTYWSLRFTVSLIFTYRDSYKGKSLNIIKAIKLSKGYIWNYFLGSLMLMLVNLVPTLLMIITPRYIEELIGKVIVVSISLIMYILLNTTFGYLPYIKVFNDEEKKPYNYAKVIANRNFKTSLVVLNFQVINLLYGTIRTNILDIQISNLLEFVLRGIPYLFQLIFSPIIIGGITLTYILLLKKRLP